MSRILSNNRGVALITSLMMTLIILGIIMALFYMISQSVKITAANKRYQNVTEATYGGAEMVAYDLLGAAWKNYSSAGGMTNKLENLYGNIDLSAPVPNNCLSQKLSSPPSNWNNCSADQKAMAITSIKSSPDLSFLLKGTDANQHYRVYAKITDTTAGNTDNSSLITNSSDQEGLISASGSAYNKLGGSQVVMQHFPFKYRIDVQGEPEASLREKSNVTVLYAY